MGDIFILSDYGKISKHDEHLLYSDYEGFTKPILPIKTDLIVLSSSVSITGEAFQILSENKIPLFILGKYDRKNISLDYGCGKNVFLRQNQFRILDDKEKSLEIAKILVMGKIKNQITYAQRIARNNSDFEIDSLIEQMKAMRENCAEAKTKDEVRGAEGMAAKFYFSVFDMNIKPNWAIFGSRSQHPPRTNVNSVLSFLYTLLTCRIQVALESFGLDTMVGNLHELTYGKDTLAFDIVEEFRTPFADMLCCYLFNNNMLLSEDFRKEDDAILLCEEGRKKVITAFEEKMDSEIFYEPLNKKISYKKVILKQAELYRNFIAESVQKYIPFSFK